MSRTASSERTAKRVLIACIGNIFLGDDGFGVEVARRLQGRQYPEGVQVIDFGIRGMELAYTLLDDGYDILVLVDAIPRGGPAGTLYLIEPDLTGVTPELGVEASRAGLAAHSMDPVKVLAFATVFGARPTRILLVGCEPTTVGAGEDYTEMQMGLSEPVQAAVGEAVKMIDSLVGQLVSTDVDNR